MRGFLIIFGPAIALGIAGYVAAIRGGTRWLQLVLVAFVGTAAWLVYVALTEHHQYETPGKTVFGTTARYDAESGPAFLIPLAGFAAASAAAGWRRVASPLAVGAAVVAGPLLLAYSTTPQGDGSLWLLIFLYLPIFGFVGAFIASIAQSIAARDEAETSSRVAWARVAGMVADGTVFGSLGWAIGTPLADAGLPEIPGLILGIVAAVAYLALPLALGSATLGHRIAGLRVIDATTEAPPTVLKAVLRCVVIVGEFVIAPFVFGAPFLIDFLLLRNDNTSLADRLCRTRVVRRASGSR